MKLSARARGRGGDRQGTRTRLIESAERIFSESGMDAVSLRRVAAAAGVNSAAVHYHFGSREALIEGVVLHRVDAIAERRHAILAVPETRDAAEVRRMVEAVVLPWAELIDNEGASGRAYVRLMAKLYTDGRSVVSGIVTARFGESYREIGDRVARALPHIPRPVLNRRLVLVLQAGLSALTDPDVFAVSGDAVPTSGAVLDEVIDFLTAGLLAEES